MAMQMQQQQESNKNNQQVLRRSVSDPRLSRHRSRRHRTFSTTSSKSSWSSKLAKILSRLALFSGDSDLTEESLQAHNKRIREQELQQQQQLHDKTPKSSPYYRGLTDSSLAMNYHYGPLTPGPGGPHYASSSATQITSFSSIVVSKLKGWAPCLGKSNNHNDNDNEKITKPPPDKKKNNNISIVQNKSIRTVTKTASSSSSKPVEASWVNDDDGGGEEKLLRERLYARRGGGGGGAEVAAAAAEKERYTWGDKYRPKVLEEFICNRKKARQLKEGMREKGQCRHYIFEGAPGVGKRTMIRAMLREAFGRQAMEVYYQYDLTLLKPSPFFPFFYVIKH